MSNELISKAMILAAGRGQRMGALTQQTPKPLLRIEGQPLIACHLVRLAQAGIREVIINLGYLGEQIRDYCEYGERWGLRIQYSHEGPEPIGTASGIKRALPKLGDKPFLLTAADVLTDYPLTKLRHCTNVSTAHVVLVPNPEHHPQGDFSLSDDGRLSLEKKRLTYAAMGVFHPSLFHNTREHGDSLGALLYQVLQEHRVSAECYDGLWFDIGTEKRLARAQELSGGAICST